MAKFQSKEAIVAVLQRAGCKVEVMGFGFSRGPKPTAAILQILKPEPLPKHVPDSSEGGRLDSKLHPKTLNPAPRFGSVRRSGLRVAEGGCLKTIPPLSTQKSFWTSCPSFPARWPAGAAPSLRVRGPPPAPTFEPFRLGFLRWRA